MSRHANKLQCLTILAENCRKPSPGMVDSEALAARLNLSLQETRELIKCLDDSGDIEADLEGQRSLITRKGLLRLERCSLLC